MSLTLLLDLDDTLLVNDIEIFLPNYLQAFAKAVKDYVDPDKFVATLLAGTRQMVKNQRPDCTLREVFNETFFPALERDEDGFQHIADRFYVEIFPTLKRLTRALPEAVKLVEQAMERGYKIAIATNPLFPRTAILQRLTWAGLPVEQYSFDLITSFETFHFVKPEPAFFAEVLARLGWPDGPVIMVGDDLKRDITASRRMGLAAFWIRQDDVTLGEGPDAPTAMGELEDILSWLDNTPTETLQPDYTSPSAMLAILRATPAALDSLCRDLAGTIWTARPAIDEWCLTEILCHLRDVDREVNLSRVQQVLQETNPFLPGRDTDPWAEKRQYIRQDGSQALHQFMAARLKLLDSLESMHPENWQNPARHAIFGPTNLAEIVSIIAGHDRLHLQQVHHVLNVVSPQS